MRGRYLVITAIVTLGVVGSVDAQFGKFKLPIPGAAPSPTAVGAQAPVDVSALQSKLDASVLEVGLARKVLIEAQLSLATALGVKEQADKIVTAANMLSSGGVVTAKTADDVSKQIQVSKELKGVLDGAASSAAPLNDEAKQHFSKGKDAFRQGLVLEAGQCAGLTALSLEIKEQTKKVNSDPSAAARVAGLAVPAAKLASLVPGDVKAGYETYTLIRKVGADNNIQVEDVDVDKYLKGAE